MRIEVMPPDELPAASPAVTVRPQRDALGRFLPGNTACQGRRLRPGVSGLVGSDRCTPEYRPFARWGARYAAHRRRELAQAHGGEISAGVGAIVESAAMAMASSRYLQHRATQAADTELFRQATNMSQIARQHELAAWELAAREAAARREASPQVLPWFTNPEEPTPR